MATTIRKVLIANRGEIARRIMRTLRDMGIVGVAVYSDADAAAPHVSEADEAVRIGAAPSTESYLDARRIVDAALKVGADAVHPGYGFLAENADFAELCVSNGLEFIGPPVDAIRRMGSKIEAKRIMEEAGVPVIPGFAAEGMSDDEIAAGSKSLGFPVLLKASAGGGGKGMRVVGGEAELPAAIEGARREASASFGDDTLLVERYFQGPRHVEIQIFGDKQGNIIHCFERECSIQRRHQKVIEEAPSPALDEALRAKMGEAAVSAGKVIGYTGAGTVEFILDPDGNFYFLEVNTRLQVEHPVTEEITALDLVRMQIDVARGLPLGMSQADLEISGHAMEARLYAEDPANDFLPSTGKLALWNVPNLPGFRCDSGVECGSEVSVHYDPMLAKLIAFGPTREDARLRLIRGLEALGAAGVVTNRDFLVGVLQHDAFVAGDLDTHFIERHVPASSREISADAGWLRSAAIAATVADHRQRRLVTGATGPLPASIPSGWRNNRWRPQDNVLRAGDTEVRVDYLVRADGGFEVQTTIGEDVASHSASICSESDSGLALEVDDVRRSFSVAREGEAVFVHGYGGVVDFERVPRFPSVGHEDVAGGCVAPMTGVIRKVCVAEGDHVEEGQLLLVLEAMKMEHQLVAHMTGVVAKVGAVEGQMVDPDEVLVVVDAEE